MSNTPKLIIIKSKKKHFWQSCQVIEEQIFTAFEISKLEHIILEIDSILNNEQIALLKNLSSSKLCFYFVSDSLKFQDLCKSILDLNLLSTSFYFHIYGNVTMEIYRWLELGKLLKGKDVHLLGSSLKSCQQISKFFKNASISCLPFCYEPPSFVTESEPSETLNLVYAGRITPQKNIIELLDAFKEAFKFNPNLRLNIAGDFHNRGYHLHGYEFHFDKFKMEFEKRLGHPGIFFHGALRQNELLELYGRSDYFISMSTYHDEDFGMSACQAACIGLGLILSDWGGHSDFKKDSTFIPVNVDGYSIPKISSLVLLKELVSLKKHSFKREGYYSEYFSYNKFILRFEKLMGLEAAHFEGVSDLYLQYAALGVKTFPFFNSHQKASLRNFYLAIYDSYLIEWCESDRLYRL